MEKRVFIAVLNWGLGHATRMVPVISEVKKIASEVLLSSSGNAKIFLKNRFPDLEIIDMPDVSVSYSGGGASFYLAKRAILQPGLNKKQHDFTAKIIAERNISHIISDNVYGAYSQKIPSALVTHQLQLKAPVLTRAVNKKLARWLENFSEVWTPDLPGDASIAGEMAMNKYYRGELKHLGYMSRFDTSATLQKDIDYLAVLSGPEPQRGILEEILIQKFSTLSGNKVMVGGKPGALPKVGKLEYFDFLGEEELQDMMKRAKLIICRSGYSTILDLVKISASACIIPTPQQPEQKYLAQRMREKGWFYTVEQHDIFQTDFESLLSNTQDFGGFLNLSGRLPGKDHIEKVLRGFWEVGRLKNNPPSHFEGLFF